jgi:hypothetical protein
MGHSMRFLASQQSQANRNDETLWRVLSLQLEDIPLIPQSGPVSQGSKGPRAYLVFE